MPRRKRVENMQKSDEAVHGVYVIATTFTESGQVDIGSVDSLIDFYLEEGVHWMTVLGVMGEAPKLTDSGQTALLKRYSARAPGPVMDSDDHAELEGLFARLKSKLEAFGHRVPHGI